MGGFGSDFLAFLRCGNAGQHHRRRYRAVQRAFGHRLGIRARRHVQLRDNLPRRDSRRYASADRAAGGKRVEKIRRHPAHLRNFPLDSAVRRPASRGGANGARFDARGTDGNRGKLQYGGFLCAVRGHARRYRKLCRYLLRRVSARADPRLYDEDQYGQREQSLRRHAAHRPRMRNNRKRSAGYLFGNGGSKGVSLGGGESAQYRAPGNHRARRHRCIRFYIRRIRLRDSGNPAAPDHRADSEQFLGIRRGNALGYGR